MINRPEKPGGYLDLVATPLAARGGNIKRHCPVRFRQLRLRCRSPRKPATHVSRKTRFSIAETKLAQIRPHRLATELLSYRCRHSFDK